MSVVKIISPAESLIEEVASRLPANETDLSMHVVVFPGKRPAHFLRKALADRLRSGFIPPRIFSIDAFVEFLAEKHLGPRKKMLSVVDALAVLYDVHAASDARVGGESFASLDAFLPVGMKLIGELEEVVLADLSIRRIREVLSAVQFPKFHALAYYYEKFYEEIDKRGCTTRAQTYRAVAENIGAIAFDEYEGIILAGFYAFTNIERKIVSNLLERSNVSLIFQDGVGLAEQLKWMSTDSHFQSKHASAGPRIHYYKGADTHGQVFALAAVLHERIRSGDSLDERTAIVLPSAGTLFPVVQHALSLLPEEGYNVALGYPLIRTPIYGFLNGLMNLVTSMVNGKVSSRAYLQFILHPYTKNIRFGSRSDVTRIFIHALEDHLINRRARLLFSLEDLEADGELFLGLERRLAGVVDGVAAEQLQHHLVSMHDNTIRKFTAVGCLGEFASRAIDVLTYIADHSTANLHPFFRPYLERLLDICDAIKTSLLAEQQFNELLGYFTFFRSLVQQGSVPFTGTPLRGVQVLGLLETRNLKFDTLYVLDATDDVLPGSQDENLLLPQPIRQMHGLETYRDRERLIEYYFDLAVRSAKNVHLFYTDTGRKEKSRFVEKLVWQGQRELRQSTTEEFEQTIRYRVQLANRHPDPIAKNGRVIEALHEMPFSAHALDTYLDCQVKFYYQNLLRLRERDEASDDVDPMDVGRLVHDVLAQYFKPLIGKPLERLNLTRDRLESVIDRCFIQEFGNELTGVTLLFRRQVSQQLWQFVEKHQHPLADRGDVIIKAVEHPFEVEHDGVKFTGRIDRIELRGNRTYIMDYKTGADVMASMVRLDRLNLSDRTTWRDAVPSLQLPLYMLLYSQYTQTPVEAISPAYLVLGQKLIDEDIEVCMADDAHSPADVYHAVLPIVSGLVEEIFSPETSFTPTDDPESHCPQCPYAAICGTQWIQSWRGE